MTWVLAKPFIQNYSLVIADICVEYKDKSSGASRYSDCLLKIHDISRTNGLIVGFAGDVKNAFSIIDDMRFIANELSLKEENRKFDLLDFIKAWRDFTITHNKHLYADNSEQAVHLIVAGNHTENNSTGNKYPPCSIVVIKSPEYRPMGTHVHQWTHIGSGAGMKVCKEILDELSNDIRYRILAIDNTPEGIVDFIVPKISRALELRLSEKGVSKHLTIGISTIGGTGLAQTFRIDESLPKLAKTYDELEEIFEDNTYASYKANLK